VINGKKGVNELGEWKIGAGGFCHNEDGFTCRYNGRLCAWKPLMTELSSCFEN